mgnify:CR=1 FL=1
MTLKILSHLTKEKVCRPNSSGLLCKRSAEWYKILRVFFFRDLPISLLWFHHNLHLPIFPCFIIFHFDFSYTITSKKKKNIQAGCHPWSSRLLRWLRVDVCLLFIHTILSLWWTSPICKQNPGPWEGGRQKLCLKTSENTLLRGIYDCWRMDWASRML